MAMPGETRQPTQRREPHIEVCIEARIPLTVAEVWPDGDAPTEVTADAVKAVMERCGYKTTTLREWNLLDAVEVDVLVFRGVRPEVRRVWS